jgi:16S rRNA (guanine527-N7)-methyltransferase
MMELLTEAARKIGLTLTPAHLRAFQAYYEELIAWNQRFNLTAITEYDQGQIRHFLDSLTCLLAIDSDRDGKRGERRRPGVPAPGTRAIDVGSGAGFPGLPIKILHPQLDLTLLEATGKKAEFLEHVVAHLALKTVTVIHGRAEEAGQEKVHREGYDLVLARAVADLPVLVEYLLPLCRLGGKCIAQKGSSAHEELAMAQHAIALLGGEMHYVIPVELPGLAETRHLVVINKVARTPQKYPRRPGIPSKRPLLNSSPPAVGSSPASHTT